MARPSWMRADAARDQPNLAGQDSVTVGQETGDGRGTFAKPFVQIAHTGRGLHYRVFANWDLDPDLRHNFCALNDAVF
jgi:hypothetical protein